MKFIVGFFMAWGNFLALPCPYKRWDSSLKNLMLAFLPSVGAVVGALWIVVLCAIERIGIGENLSAVIMMTYIFAICGFLHLDGFMDCNDAILSRRPMEERQRILKDSTVGAFAVVMLIFLVIAWFAAMKDGMGRLTYGQLLLIPVISRYVGGDSVLTYEPIGHSQYVEDYGRAGKVRYRVAMVAQLVVFLVIAMIVSGPTKELLVTVVVEELVAMIACGYGRRQLGGMSGDIAGYTICVAEFSGIVAAVLV